MSNEEKTMFVTMNRISIADERKVAHSGATSLPKGTFSAPAKPELFETFTDLAA